MVKVFSIQRLSLRSFFWIQKFERFWIVLASSAALTLLLLNLDFNLIEANLYDFRMSRGIQTPSNHAIVLITLDDSTTKELDEFPPLSLSAHAKFLEALEPFHPKAVGYLIDMNHVNQVNPKKFQGSSAHRFIQAALHLEKQGTAFLFGTPFDVTGEVPPPPPLNSLPHSVAMIHKDGNVFSEDKITRRALLTLYEKPTFHLDLARRLGYLGQQELPLGSFLVPEVDGKYFFFKYHGNTQLRNKVHSDLSYPHYSFADVIKTRLSQQTLENKIVLVGTLSLDDSSDFALTPYSKASFTNPKLIVHANILDSIIQNDGIQRVPKVANGLITFGVTAIVLWWIMTSTPLYGVFATLGLAVGFILISQILFQVKGIWIRESQPLVGIFVGYYLAVPYRLIREYKKRWDYQRKNELLTQVEELKTNFLSLVTHDLKTPVARIQGLAEVLLSQSEIASQAPAPLIRKNETIQHLLSATEELNHFISSILELNRVESNPVNIRKESKDINQLIERAIESFKTQAEAQRIQILVQLEPLFPIKIDAPLISKVLNNLIDNALKYSLAESIIRIESKEENEWVAISVQDQGIGMTPEEQQNLFTRFYRAKNATTASIPGTGLGLYLTKYFVEAHQGRVAVKTQINQGSIFKIYLPLQEGDSKCSKFS